MALFRAQAPGHGHRTPLRVHAILWNALGAGSIAYALTELFDNLPAHAVDRYLWCLRSDPASPHEYDRAVFPRWAYRAFARFGVPATIQGHLGTRVALPHVKSGDIVYFWPPYDVSTIQRCQQRGATVVAERTNCMDEMGREVLTRAYARRGMNLPEGLFPEESVAKLREQILSCDFVTAANPLVAKSLSNIGFPTDRIIETSYGFNPLRLKSAMGIERPSRPPVYAFVGMGIVRKGLDVLLEAWAKANIKGTLLIAGTVGDEISGAYATTLARPDVKVLGYIEDIARVYAAADVFVFPTHEEGGPQVVYEAAGCGLASIVSPMGAGRIVRDQRECIIIDPLSVDDVASAIRRLSDDEEFRRTLGANAASRARDFTWDKVGLRLYEQLRSVAENRSASALAAQ